MLGYPQRPPEAMFVRSEWPDGMAWAGNHCTPCPAHPDQGGALESEHRERKNAAVGVAVSYLGPLSQSLCAHICETATSQSPNPLTLRGQPESVCPLGSTGEFQSI